MPIQEHLYYPEQDVYRHPTLCCDCSDGASGVPLYPVGCDFCGQSEFMSDDGKQRLKQRKMDIPCSMDAYVFCENPNAALSCEDKQHKLSIEFDLTNGGSAILERTYRMNNAIGSNSFAGVDKHCAYCGCNTDPRKMIIYPTHEIFNVRPNFPRYMNGINPYMYFCRNNRCLAQFYEFFRFLSTITIEKTRGGELTFDCGTDYMECKNTNCLKHNLKPLNFAFGNLPHIVLNYPDAFNSRLNDNKDKSDSMADSDDSNTDKNNNNEEEKEYCGEDCGHHYSNHCGDCC